MESTKSRPSHPVVPAIPKPAPKPRPAAAFFTTFWMAGTVTQLRASTQELVRAAKRSGCAVIMFGHVTKDGQIAGPRVIEHMVDTVLYFEGDRGHSYRILRAVKNRFGSTNEIGVFEMGESGLSEVLSPSELFLSERPDNSPGSVVVPSLEEPGPFWWKCRLWLRLLPLLCRGVLPLE